MTEIGTATVTLTADTSRLDAGLAAAYWAGFRRSLAGLRREHVTEVAEASGWAGVEDRATAAWLLDGMERSVGRAREVAADFDASMRRVRDMVGSAEVVWRDEAPRGTETGEGA